MIDNVPSEGDVSMVALLLGRIPGGNFAVGVRRPNGSPVVIVNDPLMFDGTPMPTRYWLVDRVLCQQVSRLESSGGVGRAAEEVGADAIALAHERYAAQRDREMPAGHMGPRPGGGVGGTRRGVKCLHAHLAWFLAGGEDPVGLWVARSLVPPIDRASFILEFSGGE
jgi:hypothetical protein